MGAPTVSATIIEENLPFRQKIGLKKQRFSLWATGRISHLTSFYKEVAPEFEA